MQVSVMAQLPHEDPPDFIALLLTQFEQKDWRAPNEAAQFISAVRGQLDQVVQAGDFQGKAGQRVLLYGDGNTEVRRLMLLGLGDIREGESGVLRETAAIIVEEANKREGGSVAVLLPPGRRFRNPKALQALTEGAVLGAYRFNRYKTEKSTERPVEQFDLILGPKTDMKSARIAVRKGFNLGESQNLARDLSNQPPCDLNPVTLARTAVNVSKEVGLRCRILGPPALRRLKMNAMIAVGQGSTNESRLIVLEHNAPKKGKINRRPTVCLVGKGVTFDSGGLSLKPSNSMIGMKHDMSGGATVLGTMRAAALLRLPLHLVGIVGAVENMPSGTAYRPDDVIRSASGQTIEIGNTDAEGRLVLADALHYAIEEFNPSAIIDIATLTGACIIALGTWCAAVLSNNDKLAGEIIKSGDNVGERFWQLPLWKVHRKHMKSHIADVKQIGGRDAGTITAAAFLSHFVGETPWAHLDIAGTANTDRSSPLQTRGATGFGVRALIELLLNFRGLDIKPSR